MKNLFLNILTAIVLCGCMPSKMDKANLIVAEHMNMTLANIDSYEAVNKTIDSAFVSIYTDSKIQEIASELLPFDKEFEELMVEYKAAQPLLGLLNSYNELLDDSPVEGMFSSVDELSSEVESTVKEYQEELDRQVSLINERKKELKEGVFCGWNIHHRYRFLDENNAPKLADILIVVDEDLEIIKTAIPINDDKHYDYDDIKAIVDKYIEQE